MRTSCCVGAVLLNSGLLEASSRELFEYPSVVYILMLLKTSNHNCLYSKGLFNAIGLSDSRRYPMQQISSLSKALSRYYKIVSQLNIQLFIVYIMITFGIIKA